MLVRRVRTRPLPGNQMRGFERLSQRGGIVGVGGKGEGWSGTKI